MFQIVLPLVVLLPIVGGILTLFLPQARHGLIRGFALAVSGLTLLGSLVLALVYAQKTVSLFSEATYGISLPWIPAIGINLTLNVDGISVVLIVLTALLALVCIGASYRLETKVKHYMAFMLLLAGGIIGVFAASNLFLFYIFWELMLIPAYFLVGSWGSGRRVYAALKFVIFTSVGSLLMLAGIIALGVFYQRSTGCAYTLDLGTLLNGIVDPATGQVSCKLSLDHTAQIWLLLAFAAAFAVKIPFVPFHNWQPDTYSAAPAPVTALIAGAMSKAGAYGFLRFCIPLFPLAIQDLAPLFRTLAVIGILYCAVLALVQVDVKRLLAYSSISHLGVVMLGMFAFNAQGAEGSVLQMVNHGITTAALFLIAGFIEERTGTRKLTDFGGIATKVPVLATVMLIAALSSLGLPGLNSFTGEFLSLLGAFRNNVWFGTIATIVVVPAAWYMLRFFQGMMVGRLPKAGPVVAQLRKGALPDIRLGEFVVILPLLALIVYIGLQPNFITALLHSSVANTIQNLGVLFVK
ncbi:NADH dehydrogenase subunit M [Thermosporothrix hazakensis]|jgi:NADH-quinone oxidoreductase subunit M|uniref:NADH dehydrogenase subunit M n=2 Tax=Thermosporothrix TaxID=768650 RepID=A0A326U3K4_THEHA|nr:NADH-quinone oxidoreductase subunit M [Thermosporothrix hazakensis]PZW23410.1 NADH dehydrogenase subunit M [Thermosporothrix hazakensis]BBH89755.1 NADH:ubiquinone oxidoreductase subunit M [Thermosporothrix sp. COM3]GCE47944.1 NADH:ubiquinone oxidoreductase subunit M [Thermosporothrix hazakensis]